MKDLVGERYGRLVVLEEAERYILPSGKKVRQWICICDCGNQTKVFQAGLKGGTSKSCGCLRDEISKKRNSTHSMNQERPYSIWQAMKTRCSNKNAENYQYYGGKGISFDPKWSTFDGFWEDMKEGYEDHLTLDRIDSNDNYCKENCRWVSPAKQSRNRKMSKNNTSGATGVVKEEKRKGDYYWVARWYTADGKLKRRGFSINKHGEDVAFSEACKYRENMIQHLNEMGAGYTETHGY